MSFLSPLFLFGALAAAIPIVLHLLRRQPDVRVAFSAVHLLENAPVESRERRRLRELILLALRVAALLLLAFAFARPFFGSDVSAGAGRATIIALDVSLSLSAPGQFERARQRAHEVLERVGGSDLTSVVVFDATARVASPLSADPAQAAQAIDAARAGSGATRYREALRVAAQTANGRPGQVIVITDMQASGWAPDDRATIPESLSVEVVDIGEPPPNLSVASVRLDGARVAAALRNTGATARDVRVMLQVNSDPAASSATPAGETTVALAAGQTSDVTFPAPRGRWLSVAVDDPDGWAGDNRRFLVLESTTAPRVLVVTATGDLAREAFFVQQALIAQGGDRRTYEVTGVAASALGDWDDARLNANDAIVILSTRGLEHRGRERLTTFARAGGGLLIAAGPEVDGDTVAGVLQARLTIAPPAAGGAPTPARTMVPGDGRHPVLQRFRGRSSLNLVRFNRVSAIRAAECPTLAQFTSGEPALVECAVGDGRAILLASDLGKVWNDFPLHATFVPFLHETVAYVSRAQTAGEYVAGLVPSGLTDAPGVWPFARTAGDAPQLVAVNVDPAESEVTRLSTEQFTAPISRIEAPGLDPTTVGAREREERQHIWQYVLALMVLAMIVESLVAARTA